MKLILIILVIALVIANFFTIHFILKEYNPVNANNMEGAHRIIEERRSRIKLLIAIDLLGVAFILSHTVGKDIAMLLLIVAILLLYF